MRFTILDQQQVKFSLGTTLLLPTFIGGKEYPIGRCCVDIVNLDETVLKEIDQRVWEFIPAAQALLAEKTDSAAALTQEKLDAVWDIVFSLPVYRDLRMDEECCLC